MVCGATCVPVWPLILSRSAMERIIRIVYGKSRSVCGSAFYGGISISPGKEQKKPQKLFFVITAQMKFFSLLTDAGVVDTALVSTEN